VAVLKKYNLAGDEIGEVKIADDLIETSANLQMIKDYLVAIRANARQWSANTKRRAEVNHSGKKPHPQKGTGRARQGYLGAPQYKGGGRVHTPKPKFDQHIRINRKERRAAIQHLLAEKIQGNRLHILQYEPIDAPKTKRVSEFLQKRNLDDKRVLFLAEGVIDASAQAGQSSNPPEKYDNLVKSLRNIPKIEFKFVPNMSGYDITLSSDIFILESAIDELMVILGGKS
jgi:large subunit ribosomal protein L4